MHAFRAFLLVAVILVGTSEGLFLKKALLKKAVAVKTGFLADVKAAALKFKAGAALKKDAILGGFKALGKAKLGVISGIKAAKLKVLGSIAAVKLAKLAAIKAGKLAFVKTLAAAKLAPFIAKKLVVGKGVQALGGAGELLKGKDNVHEKPGNFLIDGITGILGGGGSSLPFADGNPLDGIFGSLIAGGIGGGQKLDIGNLLGGVSSLVPAPGPPEVNIHTYQVQNPVPIQSYGPPEPIQSYGPPPPLVTSYGVPVASQSPSYSHPATSYGVPQY